MRTAILLVAASMLLAGMSLAGKQTRALRQAQKLLQRLELVDGTGSGLDADLLQGRSPDAFEPAGNRVSTTVSGLEAGGSRIVLDDATGLEVVTGASPIETVFANRNASKPIHVRGVAMYNAANTTFLDFEIPPAGSQSVRVAAAGTYWFDVMAVTKEPVAGVRRFHATCTYVDSSTSDEVAWSCIGVR